MSSQRMSFNFQNSFTAVELLVSLIGLGLLVAGLLTTEQMKIIPSTILFKLPFDNVSPTDIEGPSLFIGLLRTCSKINSNASEVCTPQSLVYPIYNISALSHANLNMTGGPSRYIRPPSLYPPLFIVISISFLFIFAFMNVIICLRRLRYLKFMGHRWIARIHNMLGVLSAIISLPIFAYLYLHFLKVRLDFNDRLTLDDPPVYLYAVAGISNQLLWSGAAICVPSIISSLFHINLKRTAIVDSAMVPKRQRGRRRTPPGQLEMVSVPPSEHRTVGLIPFISTDESQDSGDHHSSRSPKPVLFATRSSNSLARADRKIRGRDQSLHSRPASGSATPCSVDSLSNREDNVRDSRDILPRTTGSESSESSTRSFHPVQDSRETEAAGPSNIADTGPVVRVGQPRPSSFDAHLELAIQALIRSESELEYRSCAGKRKIRHQLEKNFDPMDLNAKVGTINVIVDRNLPPLSPLDERQS